MKKTIDVDNRLILNKIMEYKKFSTKAGFAAFLGISTQNLSAWYKRNTFDRNKIVDLIPEINTFWLLTGEGEMLNTQEGNDDAPKVVAMNSEEYEKAMKSGATLIPEYNTTFHAGSGIISESEALVAHWTIPGAPKNAHIVPMAGDSMQPKLMSGCKLLVKPCYFSSGLDIPFGNVFAIAVSDEFGGISTHVKVLKRHKEKDKETTHWVAHSINTDYDDFEIPITHVKALSIVVMTMSQYMIL